MPVTTNDLTRVLDTVRAMNDAGDDAFERTLLAAATALIACDTVSYNEHHLDRQQELRCLVEPSYVERSPVTTHYLRHLGQHPPIAACAAGRLAGGDCVAVSDMMSARAFQRLPIHAEYFRHRGVEDQLVGVVKARDARSILVVFSRSRRGFNTRDRDALRLLVPHIQHSVRHRRRLATLSAAVSMRESVTVGPQAWETLTDREKDVVACLASGATDQRIARTLAISPRTVGKHLENVYRKTAVPGRAALIAALGDRGAAAAATAS